MSKAAHLRLVEPERSPWNQQPSEPDEAFELFWLWLAKNWELTPEEQVVAKEFCWAERAQAFERATLSQSSSGAKLEKILEKALKITDLEMTKLLNRVQVMTDSQLSVKEMMLIMAYAKESKDIMNKLLHGENVGLDLTELSDKEIDVLLSASKVAKKLGGGAS